MIVGMVINYLHVEIVYTLVIINVQINVISLRVKEALIFALIIADV